jgi:hypothetical protein
MALQVEGIVDDRLNTEEALDRAPSTWRALPRLRQRIGMGSWVG